MSALQVVTHTCTCCGEEYPHSDYWRTGFGQTARDGWVCADCVGMHYYYCPACGDFYSEDDMRQGEVPYYEGDDEGSHVCRWCYTRDMKEKREMEERA